MRDDAASLDRRIFLGGSGVLTVLGMVGAAQAQEPKAKGQASETNARRVSQAILPVAEVTNATPAEIVAACIIGAEVSARFIRPDQNGPTFDGWHATGMVGVLGAAAACARLMKAEAAAIPNIMGIAASLASG